MDKSGLSTAVGMKWRSKQKGHLEKMRYWESIQIQQSEWQACIDLDLSFLWVSHQSKITQTWWDRQPLGTAERMGSRLFYTSYFYTSLWSGLARHCQHSPYTLQKHGLWLSWDKKHHRLGWEYPSKKKKKSLHYEGSEKVNSTFFSSCFPRRMVVYTTDFDNVMGDNSIENQICHVIADIQGIYSIHESST